MMVVLTSGAILVMGVWMRVLVLGDCARGFT